MRNKKLKLFVFLKVILSIILFYAAIHFEQPHSSRLYLLLTIFFLYIFIGVTKYIIPRRGITFILVFLMEIALIYLLEYNSKYLINYFLHCYYLALILEYSFILPRNSSLIVGITTLFISLIKYIILLYYRYNFANISEMTFFILVSIFLLLIINFAHYYREEKEKKDLLYRELLNTHRKLKEYADKVEKLTAIEERNKIARDIHDSLGHIMTGIIMELEMISYVLDEDKYKAKELIDDTKKSAREGLGKIREVVETLKLRGDSLIGFGAIKELVDNFSRKTSVNIELKVIGNVVKLNPTLNITLYRTIQEGLTNAVRHGNPTKIEIILEFKQGQIEFSIRDNGKGVSNLKPGFGLTGMVERIKSLSGQIEFISEENKGFSVIGSLPLEVSKND